MMLASLTSRRSFFRFGRDAAAAAALATTVVPAKLAAEELPDRFAPESYIDFRLARGWRFAILVYLDDEGMPVETAYDEIAPSGYWDDIKAVWPREHAIEMRHYVGPAWDRAVERELVKRGYQYVVAPTEGAV